MNPQWLPPQRYSLPLCRPVHGSRDRHALLSGRLIGYGTPALQGWMTAPDLESRPQWTAAVEQFARDVAQDQFAAAQAGHTWSQRLAQRWHTRPRPAVPLALTVDEAAILTGEVEPLLGATQARAIKVKVTATTPLPELLTRLRPLSARCEVRLDANQCWADLQPGELQAILQACCAAGVASVEDPTTADRWPASTPLPLAADLIDTDLATWLSLLRARRAQLAIVKPSLFGSLDALGRVLAELADLDIPVAFSSLFDAPLGLAHLQALAAAAPGRVVASGLATDLDLDPRWRAPQPTPGPCLPDLCAQAAARSPASVALRWADGDGVWSWQELDIAVDAMAAWLDDHGVGAGTTVATWCDNHPDLLVCAWATWRLGACWQPLHPRWTLTEATAMLSRSDARLVLADAAHQPQLPSALALPRIAGLPAAAPPRRWLDPLAPALRIATSGTTGSARLVVHSHQSLHAAAAAHWARWPAASCNWLTCLPLSHVSGVSILLRTAAVAGSLTLTARGDAAALAAIGRRHAVTHLSVVPLQLAGLVGNGPPPPSLQWLLVGGASLDPGLLARARHAGWPAVPSWGMSETAGQAATGDLAEPSQDQQGLRRVGRPLPGVWLRVAAPDGPHGVGEIEVAALQRMVGYLGEPLAPGEFWPTGDLGAVGADGALWVASRRVDRIIVGGENVDPLEVEAALQQLPGVVDAAVAGVAAGARGEVVAAWLQVASGQPYDLEASLPGLAPFKRPRLWHLSREPLPRNAMGKLQRSAVRGELTRVGVPKPHWPSAGEPATK
ncbi:MAG: AMP-binding protein [Deltaproteobacteria bacterium]|nr:AMP-binding protein [Deltaproteobacteria bacterium]